MNAITVYKSTGTAQVDLLGFEVQVRPRCDSPADGAREVAEKLLDHATAIAAAELREAGWKREAETNAKAYEALRAELAAERAKRPPCPVRMLGAAVVRFRDGHPWLMNRREDGWASFAIRFDDWDELFRRFNVRVTAHGEDEHGAWWRVENCA